MSDHGEVALTVQVAASPAKIWSVIRQFHEVASWNAFLVSSKPLSGKLDAVGAEREVTATNGMVAHEQLTEQDEVRRVLEYRMVTFPDPVTAQTNRISVAAGSDECFSHVTFSARFTPDSSAVAGDAADMIGAAFIAAANGLGQHLGVDVHVIAVNVTDADSTALIK